MGGWEGVPSGPSNSHPPSLIITRLPPPTHHLLRSSPAHRRSLKPVVLPTTQPAHPPTALPNHHIHIKHLPLTTSSK